MTKEQQIYNEARRLGACPLLKGSEDFSELVALFFTPQGREFCEKYRYPTLSAFRLFRGEQAERLGVFIDTSVRAKDISRIALVGETTAELEFTETKGFHVVLMHGARAKITASGYAVVFVSSIDGKVEVVKKDNAKVFL